MLLSKKICMFLVFLCLAKSLLGFGLCGVYAGFTNIKDEKLNFFTCCGTANLKRVKVKKKVSVSGAADFNTVTIGSDVRVSGSATFSSVTVGGSIEINGSAHFQDVIIKGDLEINGAAKLDNVSTLGITTVSGSFTADDVVLKDIVISGKKALLSNSTVESIKIKRNAKGNETLELHNTTVNGDIVFDSKKGCVVLDDGSKIAGKIVGGIFCKEC